MEIFRGSLNLPKHLKPRKSKKPGKASASQLKTFQYIKSQRFPNDPDGDYDYSFEMEAWLPAELTPALDPDDSPPLPVPDRSISLAEKFAGLAAIYDAYWKGEEKIGPWSESVADRESNWYFLLIRACRDLDPCDAPVVRSWLVDVEEELGPKKRKKRRKPRKRGPKGPRTNAKEDRRLYDGWKASGYTKIADYALKELGIDSRREVKEFFGALERERKRRGPKPGNSARKNLGDK